MTAADFYATLGANVDAYYADALDYDGFHAAQVATWAAIDAAGLKDAVLAMWRGENRA